MDAEILAILILGFAVVILFSLAVIITLWVKSRSKAFIWFLVQNVLLIIVFLMLIGLLIINANNLRVIISKENTLALGIIGVLWTCSMLCMLMGIYKLSKDKTKVEEPDKEKGEYNPSLKKVFGMLAFYIFVCPIIPLIILAIASRFKGLSLEDPLANAFISAGGLGLLILWLKRKYIINFKGMFSMKKISAIFFIPMALTITGAGILLSEINNFMQRVLPLNDFWAKYFSSLSGDGFALWKAVLAVAVAAPIVEETIFRGMILRGFLKHYSVRKSIIVSALLFGIIHMNPWQFVGAFAAGIILGWWYVKTESIIPTIFGHALNNGMGFILGVIGLSIPGYNAASDISNHQPAWFDLLGVILLAAGIMWLVKLFRERQISLESAIINAEESNLF